MVKNITGIYSLGNPNKAQIIEDIYTPPLNASAVVFKDDNHVYAISPDYGLIAKGTAGVDDASVIQSAIDYAQTVKGLVSCKGEFSINQTIYVRGGVTLDLTEATIQAIADVDIFYIEKDAKVFGGVINVTGISFTKTIFKLHGEQKFGTTGHNTHIERVRCINDKATGKVFYLLCENAGENIAWVTVEDIETEQFEYVVHIQLTNSTDNAFINGNIFDNLRDTNSKYMFYLERNTTITGSRCNNNWFMNFRYQAGSNTSRVIRAQGVGNTFIGKIWDMQIAPSGALAVDLDTDSIYTLVEGTIDLNYVVDNGTNNKIVSWYNAEVLNPYILKISGEQRYIKYTGEALGLIGSSTERPPNIDVVMANTTYLTQKAFAVRVSGESTSRFEIKNNGTIWWGDGTKLDVALYRGGDDLLKTNDYFQAALGIITKVDVGDYGGNFANYTPPTGKEGLIVIAIDTNATAPGKRLYVYANGAWHYVDLV